MTSEQNPKKNFLKNLQSERANRYMKLLLVVFQEKNSFGSI